MRREPPDAASWQAFDTGATAFLKGVLERWGWPGRSLVGEQAALAAFILAQHSPDLTVQAQVLALLRHASPDEVEPAWAAYLEDRMRVRQGRPQVYGTQVGPDGLPFPIENQNGVDTRRADVGLEPLERYVKRFA